MITPRDKQAIEAIQLANKTIKTFFTLSKQRNTMKDSDLIDKNLYELSYASMELGVPESTVLKALEDLHPNNKREDVYAHIRNRVRDTKLPPLTGIAPFDPPSKPMRNKEEVLQWAEDKNLLRFENRLAQFAKTVSEIGELGDALIRNNTDEITDAIGDTVVTLIILSNQCGLDIEDCLESAYNVIKNRTGKTNEMGTFIKD